MAHGIFSFGVQDLFTIPFRWNLDMSRAGIFASYVQLLSPWHLEHASFERYLLLVY